MRSAHGTLNSICNEVSVVSVVEGRHDYNKGLSEDRKWRTDYATIHDDEHEPYYYFRVVISGLSDFYKK